jgi:hypothetical protein
VNRLCQFACHDSSSIRHFKDLQDGCDVFDASARTRAVLRDEGDAFHGEERTDGTLYSVHGRPRVERAFLEESPRAARIDDRAQFRSSGHSEGDFVRRRHGHL